MGKGRRRGRERLHQAGLVTVVREPVMPCRLVIPGRVGVLFIFSHSKLVMDA